MSSNRTTIDAEFRPLYNEWFGEVNAPLLFRAINLESWDLCRKLLNREEDVVRNELKHVDLYGYSSVHYASWWPSSPPDLFQRILELSPADYPARRNRKGRTPLHLASWRGRDEAVEHLARKQPEAVSVIDRNKKSPLTDACSRNRSKRVLEALLEADPSQIIKKNNQEMSPAIIFFRISHGFISAPHRTRFSQKAEQLKFVDKVRVILRAESKMEYEKETTLPDLNDDWELLLAAINSPSCPFSFVRVLLDRFNTKIPTFRDENGNTLLHIAVQTKPFSFNQFYKCDRCKSVPSTGRNLYFNRDPEKSHWGVRCTDPNCFRRDHNRSFHYVQVPVESKEQAIVEYILEKSPLLASTCNNSGKIPLELALMAGRTWTTGIKEIVLANPTSLSQAYESSGLYPFQLAAVGKRAQMKSIFTPYIPPDKRRKVVGEDQHALLLKCDDHDLEQLGTIFELLLQCPFLIKSYSS